MSVAFFFLFKFELEFELDYNHINEKTDENLSIAERDSVFWGGVFSRAIANCRGSEMGFL